MVNEGEKQKPKKAPQANKDAQFLPRIIKMYGCLDQMHKKSEKTVGGLVRGRKSRG